MISSIDKIITKLPGNRALIQKKESENYTPDSPRERMIQELKKRDAHVRSHEASHMSSPGVQTLGGPQLNYQIGPDGKAYAIGGQVTLTTRPAHTPEDAIQKADALKNAALSVGDPSPQDLAAASSASQMKNEAINSSKGKNLDYYA